MHFFRKGREQISIAQNPSEYFKLAVAIPFLDNLSQELTNRFQKNDQVAYIVGCLIPEKMIITIHHECPCRIEISHPRGRNFNQGRGLPSPWLNSDPEGEISLSYMDRLMMDRFSPTFPRFFVGT